jgi:hypothetical protein
MAAWLVLLRLAEAKDHLFLPASSVVGYDKRKHNGIERPERRSDAQCAFVSDYDTQKSVPSGEMRMA